MTPQFIKRLENLANNPTLGMEDQIAVKAAIDYIADIRADRNRLRSRMNKIEACIRERATQASRYLTEIIEL